MAVVGKIVGAVLRISLCAFVFLPGHSRAQDSAGQTQIPTQTEIQAAFADVDTIRRNQTADKAAADAVTLAADIVLFTKLIDKGGQPPEAEIITRAYRAQANFLLIGAKQAVAGGSPDRAAGQSALAEFDMVIKLMNERIAASDQSWKTMLADANYTAGQIAVGALHDEVLAFRYFATCAALDHFACVNAMAVAYMTGAGGVRVDMQKAFQLHKQVYASGIRYTCAGIYSAATAAMLLATGAVKVPGEDASQYLAGGLALQIQLAQNRGAPKICGGPASLDATQYFLGLAAGKPDPALLDKIAGEAPAQDAIDLIAYFKNSIDLDELAKRASAYASDSAKCDGYFNALWIADIKGDAVRAKTFKALLQGADDTSCKMGIAFASGLRTLN